IQNPTGVGLGQFPAAYGKAQVDYFSLNNASEQEKLIAENPAYAFNEYLQIGVESGVVSLILYIALIVFAMLNVLKNSQYGIFGAFISLSVFALFSYPFSMLPHLILLVSLLAATSSNTNNYSKEMLRGLILTGGIILLFMIITVFCLMNRYPVYIAYKDWNDRLGSGLYEETPERYEYLYPSLNDDIDFLFEYAQNLARHERYEQSNAILQRAIQISCDPMLYNVMGRNYQALKQYDKAEQNFITSTLLVPNRLYPYYLLTKMYDEIGDNLKAVETANIVLTKEPKIHSPAIDEMRQEARRIINANDIYN
ncbi:MAG: polymerase, partial [Firmicutes bacterium]|nr:polymerase [Bacillota bacterium]